MLKVLIRGGGDVASGIAVRLFRAGCRVLVLETEQPRAIRRSVSFAAAVHDGACQVEGVPGKLINDPAAIEDGSVNVLIDTEGAAIAKWLPDVVVDARMLKRHLSDTAADQAELVIGVGPGFTAGANCHAVVETMRGHDLGRVLYDGAAAEDTGVPGTVKGFALERILRAPCSGTLASELAIGAEVEAGQAVAEVDGRPVVTQIAGVLRGLIRPGTHVQDGEKIGDVDPRGVREYCYSVSDRSNAIAGGVLEAVLKLHLGRVQ